MAGRKPQRRREFGTTRQLPSGRWQARYIGPDGQRHTAPETFETKSDAQDWLNLVRADIERDSQGRLTYKNKVIRMYPIAQLKQRFALRRQLAGVEEAATPKTP